MPRVRTIHWGTGAMGSRALSVAGRRASIDVAAVVSHRGAAHAERVVAMVAEAAGAIVVADGLADALARTGGADVLVLATHGRLADLERQIVLGCRSGLSVICIAEDTIFPWAVDPAAAERIHLAAVEGGVAVVGTGANPGFFMDYLPLVLLSATRDWTRLLVRRKSSLDPYGPNVLDGMGVGLTLTEFEERFSASDSFGHLGFEESIGFLAAYLGVALAVESKEVSPIVRDVETHSGDARVAAGLVVGLDQRCIASAPTGERVVLEHPQVFGLVPGEEPPHDLIDIDSTPPIQLRATPGIDGGAVTAGLMVNLIPAVASAEPGLHTIADFSLRALTESRRPTTTPEGAVAA